METHVCFLQTALSLIEEEFDVWVVTDACGSRTEKNRDAAFDRLAGNGALGIFPEGGSHDRTDLLPLKIGISLIAYSALEKDGLNVPIVPVGLSYFRAHRWRGRAVVEYGRPFYIDPSTLDDYKAGGSKRRTVCNDLLEEVEANMRSVIVSASRRVRAAQSGVVVADHCCGRDCDGHAWVWRRQQSPVQRRRRTGVGGKRRERSAR